MFPRGNILLILFLVIVLLALLAVIFWPVGHNLVDDVRWVLRYFAWGGMPS